MAKQLYSFRIDEPLLDEAESYSLEQHTSVSNVIRQALFSYLSQMKRKVISR